MIALNSCGFHVEKEGSIMCYGAVEVVLGGVCDADGDEVAGG